MGIFDDLAPTEPVAAGGGMFADLAPAKVQRQEPPALLKRAGPRPSKLKRAAVNAAAAFYGADGDTAGLGSEAIVDLQSGAMQKRASRADMGLADVLDTVGLDGVADFIRGTASRNMSKAESKAAAFEIAQEGRRQAVADLGPAQGFGEKAADIGGRLSASITQPENFVGGPALKGASLGGKVLRAGSAAAVANLATEPVLQGSAVARGTRDKLSARDAAVNTGIAFATGGVFGGVAHGVEKIRGRGKAPEAAQPAAGGMFDDLAGGAEPAPPPELLRRPGAAPEPQAEGAGIFADLAPANVQTRGVGTQSADGSTRTAVLRQPAESAPPAPEPTSPPVVADGGGVRRNVTERDRAGRPVTTERLTLSTPADSPVFRPNTPPPVVPDGSMFSDLRDLAAGVGLEQTLGDLVQPEDVMPLRGPRLRAPDNRISSLVEYDRANPSTVQNVATPDERDAFTTRRLASRSDPSRAQFRKEPMDLVSWLRRQGGLKEYGGELSHLGIDNTPRQMDFARSEGFLGRLVDNENGMDLDEAAQRAWEAGYFPDRADRPDVETFMEALAGTHRGDNRIYHPNDWEALADYKSRLGDRMRVEQAAREGAPAAVIRGEPVGPDDLDARALPVEAYRADLPAARELAGNIRTDLLDSPQSIDRALREVAIKAGGFEEARRGIQSQDQTAALARDMGMTPELLLKRRKGQALNAEQALAARQLLAKSSNELVALAKRTKGGSDEDLAAFRKALATHAAIQEQVSGATAEAGRALASFRMIADSRDAQRARILEGIVIGGGGRNRIEDMADMIAGLSEPEQLAKFARGAVKARTRDQLNELWINSLLSGPQTHVVNAASNVLTTLWTLPEKAIAAGIGKLTRSADRVMFRDVVSRAVGMVQGSREGLRLAKQVFLTGEPIDAASKIEAANYRAIPGKVGEVVRIPSRLLMTSDEFFKAVARRGEINALASNRAIMQGKNAAERHEIFARLRDNPSADMIEKADAEARYLTFQKPLGGFGRGIMQAANEGPGVKLIIPFVRTPINILKFAGERSILAPLMREVRENIAKGGASRDEAIARMVMGSGLSALAVAYSMEGKLSGAGPNDPRDRAALQDTGWQPYSIKVGERWYSYQRFEPISLLAGVAADFAELGNFMTPGERDKFAMNVGIAIGKNITSKTWLSGLSDFFDALSDPERYGEGFVAKLASSFAVPAISAQIARSSDPYMREARSTLDAIKARVPGLSDNLPARMNLWGEPLTRGDALGPDLVSPIWSKPAVKDPVANEVVRLRVQLSRPPRQIGGADLTPEQYARFAYLSGKPAKALLDAYVASPDWSPLPDPLKRRVIRETVNTFRERARYQMLGENPDLIEGMVRERVQRKLEGR